LIGFLITLHLLESAGDPDYYKRFYLRRFLRIAPLYFLVLLAGIPIAAYYHSAPSFWADASFFGGIGNIAIMIYGPAIFGAFLPLWAVSVEAHCYLCWPWLIRKIRPAALPAFFAGLIALSIAVRFLVFEWAPNANDWNHYFTLSRLDSFAMGAILAVCLRLGYLNEGNIKQWAFAGAALSSLAFIVVRGELLRRLGIRGAVEVAFVTSWILVALAFRSHPAVSVGLANPVLVFFGKISYGIYLFHVFVIALLTKGMTALHGSTPYPIQLLVTLSLSTGLAYFSWRYIERPFLAFRREPTLRFSSRH
jgi:peptidoglycan/LPS O-acetylase OafA/YrhL